MGKEKFSPSETLPSQNHEPSAAPSESPSANPNRSQPSSSPDEEASELSDRHTLSSNRQGESEIEVLADRIESRRENRIPVPFRIQKNILKEFHHISEREGYTDHARIHYEDLVSLRETIEKEPPSIPSFLKKFGFICDRDLKLEIFDRAENFMEHFHMKEDGWFYYRDFMFYHTIAAPYWPWLRNKAVVAAFFVFVFYFASVIFFCHIVNDENICPVDPTDRNRSYYGWVSALYFASTTMSTVGYGDLVVEKSSKWHVFCGMAYMIFALVMAIRFFAVFAESAVSPVKSPLRRLSDTFFEKFSNLVVGERKSDELLYITVRRLRLQKISEIVLQFCVLNLIGVFVSRYFVNHHAITAEEEWDWMTSLYWAVQTTTTIGYGDVSMRSEMRWFQILYLALSTYLARSALGRLGRLSQEVAHARRHHAWERREVSKGMVHDFRTDEFGEIVDQYEFAIASLLHLEKISGDDLEPIMDKFRALAGPKGYIDTIQETRVDEKDQVVEKLQHRASSRKLEEEHGQQGDGRNNSKEHV